MSKNEWKSTNTTQISNSELRRTNTDEIVLDRIEKRNLKWFGHLKILGRNYGLNEYSYKHEEEIENVAGRES